MKWLFAFAALALVFCPLSASTPAKSKSSSAATGTRPRSRKTRARRAAAPSYQLHPDPERYQQIQQALADRGYFKGQVNGQWNDDSTDALKRFQADQKLDSDGKINSLSLIHLGLGPKHDGTTAESAKHIPMPDPAAPEEPAALPPAEPSPEPPQSTQ